MNTIYDNTFTIGQTSAINFEAGPGIQISEPTAGTVRIGNDETVLYDGENSGGTLYNNNIPLSESYKNFNTIKIMNGHYSIGEFPSQLLSGHQDAKIAISFQDASTAQPICYGLLRYSATNDTTLIQYFNRVVAFSTAGGVSVATNASNYNTRTFKVIGINRIGGNV